MNHPLLFSCACLQTSSCGLVIIKETPLICPIIGIATSADSHHIGKPDANGSDNNTGKATTGGSTIGK